MTTSNHNETVSRRYLRTVLRNAVILFLLLPVSYVLSSGPMQFVSINANATHIFFGDCNGWDEPFLTVYQPLIWLDEQMEGTPSVISPLYWYWATWSTVVWSIEDMFVPDITTPYRTHGGVI